MAAPKPSNKSARMTRNKTGAIAASQARTKAQTAPGVDYKAEQAEKAKKSYGSSRSKPKGPDRKKKHADRMAKMRETTNRIRANRAKMNATLPKIGG